MSSKGKSNTTIGIFLRYARTINNHAFDDGFTDEKYYSFGKKIDIR